MIACVKWRLRIVPMLGEKLPGLAFKGKDFVSTQIVRLRPKRKAGGRKLWLWTVRYQLGNSRREARQLRVEAFQVNIRTHNQFAHIHLPTDQRRIEHKGVFL